MYHRVRVRRFSKYLKSPGGTRTTLTCFPTQKNLQKAGEDLSFVVAFTRRLARFVQVLEEGCLAALSGDFQRGRQCTFAHPIREQNVTTPVSAYVLQHVLAIQATQLGLHLSGSLAKHRAGSEGLLDVGAMMKKPPWSRVDHVGFQGDSTCPFFTSGSRHHHVKHRLDRLTL